jgi:hypothetical protein
LKKSPLFSLHTTGWSGPSSTRRHRWTADHDPSRHVDRYGRSLGSCTVEGQDVSSWLVRNGWALAFRRYSFAYVGDEDYAREHSPLQTQSRPTEFRS